MRLKKKYLFLDAFSVCFYNYDDGSHAMLLGDDAYIQPVYHGNKMAYFCHVRLNASDFKWSSSDPEVISVDGGHKGLKTKL